MSTALSGAIPTSTGGFGGTVGWDFAVNHTGTVDGIWWYQPLGSAATVTPGLYDTQTQALIATAPATPGLPAGAWSMIPLTASVALTPGTVYTAAAFQNNAIGWFSNGVLDQYRFASPFTILNHSGRVGGGPLQFPTGFSNDIYGVDVNFTATEPCEPCPPCPPTVGFLINLTSPGFINVVTGVGQCVIEALDQTPAGAPCRQCLLLPTQTIPWDNCGGTNPGECCGQVALAIREVYGSDQFPRPLNGASWRKCNHRYEVVRAVVSVTRCVPCIGEQGQVPECSAELAAAVILENDRTAIRQSIACCLASANLATPWLVSEWVIGSSVTVGESGCCAGVETEFYVGVQSCLCPN